ncbi:Lethal(2) giant larvae sro7 [Stygiomarasmius scandens]|uniref:Lethal(2) giant larvae sro7 n=1 Tax=Marasmiellus scandens TaxID=2682957 RepID=A0ABR1JQ45_9AGAR
MFLKRHDHTTTDLSIDVQDKQSWKPAALRTWEHILNVSALAFEPTCGLLAVGTSDGNVILLGRPGVEVTLTLPDPLSVKSLQISASTFRLVALDARNQLHLWDLSHFGRPKYLVSAKFEQANSLTISPSHCHAFISLQSGEIRTYDLACLRKSPYTMPNLWTLYADKMAASGLPEASSPTLFHWQEEFFFFTNIKKTARATVRVFELVLPPGAPGGSGYGAPDILTQRRPEVTCMAIHPAGHFFAVGYADGSIAFWAIEDEDQPILVRTLDHIDVNVVNALELETLLSEAKGPEVREPIFKLAWCSFPNSSDPRGGNTALVVLGGLSPTEDSGVTVYWLPAFNPSEAPSTASTSLHPSIRSAMRDSVAPSKTYFYYADGIVQDFLLVPRDNPHFSGANDPIAILFTREAPGGSRVVDAFQFPPPAFRDSDKANTDQNDADTQDTLIDLASTLQAMKMNDDPRGMQLPCCLSNASSGMIGGHLYRLDREAYQKLTEESAICSERELLPLRAGFAWCDQKESSMSKYQPSRVLVTSHSDLSVRMWDVSPQLLLSSRPTPIQHYFPHPLLNLHIDLGYLLSEPLVMKKLSGDKPNIQIVKLASETLDCAIVLTTGDVIIEGLIPTSDQVYTSSLNSSDEELTSLQFLPALSGSAYSPLLILTPHKGSVSAIAMSDLGLLAVAYQDGSLYAIDTRKDRVVVCLDTKEKRRHSSILSIHADKDPIVQLLWTICPTSTDSTSSLRLLAAHDSGSCQVFAFNQSQEWVCGGEPVKLDVPSHPLGLFVLDKKNGARCKANRRHLNDSRLSTSADGPRTFFIAVGLRGARVHFDLDGHRAGKVDWSSKMGKVLGVQVVERLGSFALAVFTEHQEAWTYSLPDLEFMHQLSLPVVSTLPLTADDTGDFIAWGKHPRSGIIQRAIYGTLFDFHRVNTLPAIDLSNTKPMVPAQPQPVSVGPASLLGSWFTFGGGITGEQIDSLLGGPDRPQLPPQQKSMRPPEDRTQSSHLNSEAAAAQSSLYSRLTSALEERGQMLGDLEDRFNALEQGSRSMADQAKRLAAEQTTKSWFKFS